MNPHSNNIIKLADAFSEILNQWIPDKIYEINLRNKEVSYIEHGYCATHDFCDPNQAMIDAFIKVFGKSPSIKNQKHNMLIDNAWTIAKTAQFKPFAQTYLNS